MHAPWKLWGRVYRNIARLSLQRRSDSFAFPFAFSFTTYTTHTSSNAAYTSSNTTYTNTQQW
jgi:hypothetical protein